MIGFMGAGKSTLGKMLANEMQTAFYDMDEMIAEKTGMTVSQIFEIQGEDYFRELENVCLRSTGSIEEGVISTGGGAPCRTDNMDWMLKHGITIYLEWPAKQLLHHAINLKNRPLVNKSDLASLGNLLQQRIPCYERAAITISCQGNLELDALNIKKLGRYLV